MRFKQYARGRTRHVPGQMNKTELAYHQLLELRSRAGEIEWFKFEGIKLKLADKTFLTPDFVIMNRTGEIELHEVKGFMEDDAAVKLKVAAENFPFKFVLVQFKRGTWEFQEIA